MAVSNVSTYRLQLYVIFILIIIFGYEELNNKNNNDYNYYCTPRIFKEHNKRKK